MAIPTAAATGTRPRATTATRPSATQTESDSQAQTGTAPAGQIVVTADPASSSAGAARRTLRAPIRCGSPPFTPPQRQLHRLIPAALAAYRKDTPKELVVVRDLARVRTDVVRIVLSGLRHRPEERMPALRVPVTLTAGEADCFAPAPWLERVAQLADGPSRVRVLPGSHNNVFPHAAHVAELVVSVMAD